MTTTPRGPLSSTVPPESTIVGGVYNAIPPAPQDEQPVALQVDAQGRLLVSSTGGGGGGGLVQIEDTSGNALNSNGAGALNVAVVSGGGSNASVGTNGAAAPASSTQVGGSDGVNLQPLQVDASKNLKTIVNAALPAGTNVIGHVITDSGSTTAVTQATAANLNAQVQGTAAIDAAATGNPVVVAGIDAAGNVQELPVANSDTTVLTTVLQVGGSVTTSAPTYTTGRTDPLSLDTAGNLRVSMTQAAGATEVVVGNKTNNNAAPGATNVGTLPAVANAAAQTWTEGDQVALSEDLSGNLRVISESGSTTAVTQATASNLNAAVVGTKTNNNAPPDGTNIGTLFALANAASPTWTEGDQVLASVDLHGGQRTIDGNIPETTVAWTSATTLNTALTLVTTGYATATVFINTTSTMTGGMITFEVSDASTNWAPVEGIRTDSAVVDDSPSTTSNSFSANTNIGWVIPISGWAGFRARLSTVITGTGTASISVQASSMTSAVTSNDITNAVTVESDVAAANLADNQANQTFFTSASSVKDPLAVGNWLYGGAFSGAADATRSGWSKGRASTVFRTAQATASGNTAVWTPGSGNKFRLLKLFVEVTDNASLASGAVLTINFQDATTSINISFDVFVPTTAVTTVIGDGLEQELDLGDFGILSAAANNVLNVNLSAALATGNVRIIAMGTEE